MPAAERTSSSRGNCDHKGRVDALPGFIAGPKVIAKRFYDAIRRDGDVGCAAADHPQHRFENTSNGGNLAALLVPRGGQRVEVSEQLISTVD